MYKNHVKWNSDFSLNQVWGDFYFFVFLHIWSLINMYTLYKSEKLFLKIKIKFWVLFLLQLESRLKSYSHDI